MHFTIPQEKEPGDCFFHLFKHKALVSELEEKHHVLLHCPSGLRAPWKAVIDVLGVWQVERSAALSDRLSEACLGLGVLHVACGLQGMNPGTRPSCVVNPVYCVPGMCSVPGCRGTALAANREHPLAASPAGCSRERGRGTALLSPESPPDGGKCQRWAGAGASPGEHRLPPPAKPYGGDTFMLDIRKRRPRTQFSL